tara:strand:- start:18 stop:191 length:174 start_codon:yes stop_codon:yes gene_type:complete
MENTPKDIIDVLVPPKDDEDEETEMPKKEYEQRNDPDHPYCTNWPMNKKKEKKDENV